MNRTMSAGDPAKLARIVAVARPSIYAPFASLKELLSKKQTPK